MNSEKIIRACEDSLKRLGRKYIDLYNIHWLNREILIEETYKGMNMLMKDGEIRAAAVSDFRVKDLTDILEANQIAYNALFRAIEYEIKSK